MLQIVIVFRSILTIPQIVELDPIPLHLREGQYRQIGSPLPVVGRLDTTVLLAFPRNPCLKWPPSIPPQRAAWKSQAKNLRPNKHEDGAGFWENSVPKHGKYTEIHFDFDRFPAPQPLFQHHKAAQSKPDAPQYSI